MRDDGLVTFDAVTFELSRVAEEQFEARDEIAEAVLGRDVRQARIRGRRR